jgi:hypothetical protein
MNVFAGILTVAIVLTVFFGPEIITFTAKKFGRVNARIALLAVITLGVTCVTGIIVSTGMALMSKVVLCLLSIGTIILGTLFILSLLFVATIPEEMEKEAENGKD